METCRKATAVLPGGQQGCARGFGTTGVRNIMASLTLKNVKKIYPFNGDDAKKSKKKKKDD